MKKYAEGGTTRRNRPDDAVNMEALPDTPPPASRNAPKRQMTIEEIERQMRKAGQMPPESTGNPVYTGKVKRHAKGGSVTRGDGICTKGHTKGRMV
jgi:hypothetical protein